MEDFMGVIIPLYLSKLSTEYYVKGGKAYDFYFREKTNSIDWDIVMTKQTYQQLVEQLKIFGEKNGLVLKEVNRENFGMIQLSFQKGDEIFYYDNSKDPFFMDCVIEQEINENPVVWNGIRYMNMSHFVDDLITTLSNRYDKVQDKAKKFFHSKKTIIDKIKNVDSVEKTKLYLNSRLPLLEDITVKNTLAQFLEHYKPPKKLYNLGEIITDMMVDFNRVDNQIDDQYDSEGKEKPDNDKEFLEKLNEEMADIAEFFLLEDESNMIRNKYRKTYIRAQNVAKISWDKLSDDYKRYLMDNCKGPNLDIFSLGQACKAYLDCNAVNIVQDTSECFPDKEKYTSLYTETN